MGLLLLNQYCWYPILSFQGQYKNDLTRNCDFTNVLDSWTFLLEQIYPIKITNVTIIVQNVWLEITD